MEFEWGFSRIHPWFGWISWLMPRQKRHNGRKNDCGIFRDCCCNVEEIRSFSDFVKQVWENFHYLILLLINQNCASLGFLHDVAHFIVTAKTRKIDRHITANNKKETNAFHNSRAIFHGIAIDTSRQPFENRKHFKFRTPPPVFELFQNTRGNRKQRLVLNVAVRTLKICRILNFKYKPTNAFYFVATLRCLSI